MGTAIWDALFHVTRSELTGITGRKAIVVLSDGLDLNSSVHGLSEATEAAQTANVNVYTIKYVSGPYLALSPLVLLRARHEHGMETVAFQTGGVAYNHPKDLDSVYSRIEEDLRSEYVVAYSPNKAALPGTWHRVQVRAARSGAKVRAQTGYRSP